MSMSPRLLRPRQTLHPDTAAWAAAVTANGGSVSGSTLSAVDKFCKAVASTGIRDRFYRLNLFCGTGLNACLVPLYRGPSQGGTKYGNTVDTNVGPFVSGDYIETGSNGGLNSGTNTTKYLRTGIAPSDVAATPWDNHVCVYSKDVMASNSQAIGANAYSFFPGYGGNRVFYRTNGSSSGVEGQITTTSGHILAVRTSAAASDLYRNGASLAATASDNGNTAADTYKLIVFGHGSTTETAAVYFSGKLQAYSIGRAMTASQASSFYTALQAFQVAIGRNL
jgi:hypothetical protein